MDSLLPKEYDALASNYWAYQKHLIQIHLAPSCLSSFGFLVLPWPLILISFTGPSSSSLPFYSLDTRLLCPWILQARILEWAACPPPGDLPDIGIERRISCLLRILHCRWILYCWATGEAPRLTTPPLQKRKNFANMFSKVEPTDSY